MVADVTATNYDAGSASNLFLSLGEFVMAWKVYLPSGTIEVGSADLKRMAADGTILKSTEVESTTNKRRVQAGGIAGLMFKEDDINSFDFPIPNASETPPPWNPPLEQTSFKEPEWTKKVTYVADQPQGVMGMLFDVNFNAMMTPKLLGVIWILWLVLAVIALIIQGIGFVAMSAPGSDAKPSGLAITVGGLSVIGGTIAVRVTLETIAVIFKICEYLKNINDRG